MGLLKFNRLLVLAVMVVTVPSGAMELTTFNLTQGVNYVESASDYRVLIPMGESVEGIHYLINNPDFVSEELVAAWNLLREQLYRVKKGFDSSAPVNPFSREFLLRLNSRLVPEANQEFSDERNRWLSGQPSIYTHRSTRMPVDMNKITEQEMDLLNGLYEPLVDDRQVVFDYLFQMKLNGSSPELEIDVPLWAVKKMVEKHQNDLQEKQLGIYERMSWFVTSRDACRFVGSIVNKDDEVFFPYHLEYCDKCPVNPHVNDGDEVWEAVRLYYPGFTHWAAFEKLLPELLEKYHYRLAVAATPDELVGVVAEFTQLFIILHPFYDGNGRTFRLFANYVLMLYGLAPAVFDVFRPVPCTREQWREIFIEAQWNGQTLINQLPLP